jgi:hypothetical protein
MSSLKTYYLSEEELARYRNIRKQTEPNIPTSVTSVNNVNIALQSWMKRQRVIKRGSQRTSDWRWPQNRK